LKRWSLPIVAISTEGSETILSSAPSKDLRRSPLLNLRFHLKIAERSLPQPSSCPSRLPRLPTTKSVIVFDTVQVESATDHHACCCRYEVFIRANAQEMDWGLTSSSPEDGTVSTQNSESCELRTSNASGAVNAFLESVNYNGTGV